MIIGGQILSKRNLRSGNYHDLYEVEQVMQEIIDIISDAEVHHKGLFLNANSGFNSENVRQLLEAEEITANIKPIPDPRSGKTTMLSIIFMKSSTKTDSE